MKIIIGLGNYGKKYERTWHNMGFDTLQKLAEMLDLKFKTTECKSKTAILHLGDEKIVLALPQTYMNLSGEAARELIGKYKAEPKDLVVVYDDVDIPTGTLRLREEGSGGTHNGMRNIVELLGTKNFKRVRLGIGSDKGEIPLMNFVLSRVPKTSESVVEDMQKRAAEALKKYIETDDFELVMRQYNGTAPTDK